MDKNIKNAVANTVEALLLNKVKCATKYLSPTLTVRASRQLYKGKIDSGKPTIILTFGKPNYKARAFIKLCQKAKEPFPIKLIQLQDLPKKKK
jgi:hypothetical protein